MTRTGNTVEERTGALPGDEDGATGTTGGRGGAGTPQPGRRRAPRLRKVLVWTLAAALLLLGASAGYGWWRADRAADSVARIPHALPDLPERQQPPPADGVTFLLVGLDTRSPVPTTGEAAQAPAWRVGASRSDTMMLFHLSGDRSDATVVSLPRDTWTDIPGHGRAKLNAAYSWGGPALAVRTVQDLTGVRVDHLAVVDWNGFRSLTDAVGGVDVTVARDVPGLGGAPARRAGRHHFDG
ncbi:LCP family protein, partial [Streptomyces sp. TR06-5]